MAFFFLLAGYYAPASLDRKGYGQFIRDRFMGALACVASWLIADPLVRMPAVRSVV
jgi:glucans biosynthesis protein C